MSVYDHLHFTDDDIFAAQGHINPSQIINHDWKKLRLMWKSVNTDYESALTRFTVSGTHHSRVSLAFVMATLGLTTRENI
jgi:hypothetical protein